MVEILQAQEPIAVANFVIDTAEKNNISVTNFQLQKILFFLQGFTLCKYKNGIVNGPFSKWQYGPVQKNIYNTFRDNGSGPIMNKYINVYFKSNGQLQKRIPEIKITNKVRREITDFTLNLIKIPTWKLVGLIHKDPSWYNYKDKIMNYEAQDYKDDEILACFQRNKSKLK